MLKTTGSTCERARGHLYGRVLLGKPRSGRVGCIVFTRKEAQGAMRRRAGYHQQPHGANCRYHGVGGVETALQCSYSHGLEICMQRNHAVDAVVAVERMAHLRTQTGQECRFVAEASKGVEASQGGMVLGSRARRQRGERTCRRSCAQRHGEISTEVVEGFGNA